MNALSPLLSTLLLFVGCHAEHPARCPAADPTTSAPLAPASRPSLSPRAQALLEALRANANTNGQYRPVPAVHGTHSREAVDAGSQFFLDQLPRHYLRTLRIGQIR